MYEEFLYYDFFTAALKYVKNMMIIKTKHLY